MPFNLYKQRTGRLFAGVLAGFATRFNWNVWLLRAVVFALGLSGKLGLLILAAYVLLAMFLPTKEDVYAEKYGTGPRKVKDAEKIR